MAKQCIEVTVAGYRCEREAQLPTRYCWQHQAGSAPVKTAISWQWVNGGAGGKARKPAAKKAPAQKVAAKKAAAKRAPAKKMAAKRAPAKKAAAKRAV